MAAQKIPQVVGFLPKLPSNGGSTLALSATNTWLALSWVPDANRQVSKVRVFTSAVNGTLGANDLTCDVYTDNAKPNTSLESRNTVTTTPTGAATVEFTGFTSASNVTGGSVYWAVLKNANGTPGTNFPTYRFGGNDTWPHALGTSQLYPGPGVGKLHSTDGGSTWITAVGSSWGLRIEYADGTFQGVPISNLITSSNTVFAANEAGCQFAVPANARLNVRGLVIYCRTKTGTPSVGLKGKLYTGASPSLVASTVNVPQVNVANANYYCPLFSATQVIEPGTVCTVTLGEDSNSDTSGNNYAPSEYTVENDANSKALMPWGAKKAVYNGTTWTFTDTNIIPFGLALDTDGEFAAQSTGGGAPVIGSPIVQGLGRVA